MQLRAASGTQTTQHSVAVDRTDTITISSALLQFAAMLRLFC